MTRIQGELEFADTDVFMEFHDWSLLDHSPKLGEREFAIRETARSFEIDLDGKHVTYTFADEDEQLALDVPVEGWTPEDRKSDGVGKSVAVRVVLGGRRIIQINKQTRKKEI